MKKTRVFLTGLFGLVMALVMICLPMTAETVKAEEQVKTIISYTYIDANGEHAYYEDVAYVPAGTTWGSFLADYQKCFENGTLQNVNESNVWTIFYEDGLELSSYMAEQTITNDNANMFFTGRPQNYGKILVSIVRIANGVEVDSGVAGNLYLPATSDYASSEVCDYVSRNARVLNLEEYYNIPGVAVTVEYLPEALAAGRFPAYIVYFTESGTYPSPSVDVPPVQTETEHVLPNGEEVRMITVKGNSNVYVIGDPAIVPAGASFETVAVDLGEGYRMTSEAVEKFVGKGLEIGVYQMNLTDANGAAITQLKDYINVTLPIPSSITLDEGKTIVVYRYEDNGTLTRCDTVVDENMVTFATNHFSFYILVEQDASAGPALMKSSTVTSPKTGEGVGAASIIMMISVVGMAAVMTAKKKAV